MFRKHTALNFLSLQERERVEVLEQKLAAQDSSALETVSADLETLKQQLADTEAQLSEEKQKLAETDAQLATEKQRATETEAQLTAEKQIIADMGEKLESEKRWHSETLLKLNEVIS